ncbi:hypothetical protein B0H14DRAFT_3458211 [Mycena olivaceomarginata]|nr:hypothetical protein B0H14DRAFT_3458211 [Mycena olivaceomarginata]
MFPDNSIQLFNVEARQFPFWAKNICTALPKKFTHAHDHILGVATVSVLIFVWPQAPL